MERSEERRRRLWRNALQLKPCAAPVATSELQLLVLSSRFVLGLRRGAIRDQRDAAAEVFDAECERRDVRALVWSIVCLQCLFLFPPLCLFAAAPPSFCLALFAASRAIIASNFPSAGRLSKNRCEANAPRSTGWPGEHKVQAIRKREHTETCTSRCDRG